MSKSARRATSIPGMKVWSCIEDARVFCRRFFTWYNTAHHHHGIGLHTPVQVYTGAAPSVHAQRHETLHAAYALHPERFVHGAPHPPLLPAFAELAPYNVVVVALDEDPALRLVGNLVASPDGPINEIDPATIRIGIVYAESAPAKQS